MLNFVLAYVTLALIFVLQTTLGIYIDIYGIAPNVIFVFAVCYSMYNYPVRSAVLCLVAGLISDLYMQTHIGVNALLYMYMGIAISNFAGSLIKKHLITVALGVFAASILHQVAILVVSYILPGYSGIWYPLIRIIIPTALYDGAVSLIMAFWARWLSEDRIRGL